MRKLVWIDTDTQAVVPRVVSEDAHVAACHALLSASGLDEMSQRILDALIAAAPTVEGVELPPMPDLRHHGEYRRGFANALQAITEAKK